MHHHHSHRYRYCCRCWTRVLVVLPILIFVSSLSIRYGIYGDCRMVLGPSSSRLLKVSSMFVKQVEVRDYGEKGVFVYGFSEKPELSTVETKWNSSRFVIVESYSHKGFSLWLNKGSRIRIKWEAQSSNLSQLEVFLNKGEQKHEAMQSTNSGRLNVSKGTVHGFEAAQIIEEDDRYNIGIINSNPKGVILQMNVDVSSTTYDIKKAKRMCSTKDGPCRLNLSYPSPQYVVLATPDTQDLSETYIEISFIIRFVTYLGFLGVAVIITLLILKSLGTCRDESYAEGRPVSREVTENDPICRRKELRSTYGTYEEEANLGRSICVICCDNPKNRFFVPVGHCATCQECTLRMHYHDGNHCHCFFLNGEDEELKEVKNKTTKQR